MSSNWRMALGIVVCLCGCNGEPDPADDGFTVAGWHYADSRITRFKLPKRLKEVSGLALAPDGALLAHDDERAVVYRIDHTDGTLIDWLTLDDPPARDDFEGIAASAERLYLVTSEATVYVADIAGVPLPDSASEGQLPAVVEFERFESSVPCEIEGLELDQAAERLLAVCKVIDDGDDLIRVYEWPLARRAFKPEPLISVAPDVHPELDSGLRWNLKKLRPSGITMTNERQLLVLARQKSEPVLLTLDFEGRLLGLARPPRPGWHEQTEGVALTPEGTLLLADEGTGKSSKGRLGVYEPD